MKKIIVVVLLLGFAGAIRAVEMRELDQRVRTLTAKFEAMQAKPDRRIPAENLRQARGIILLDRTKAGFIFAYQGGGGVALVKDARTDQWGPVAFLGANEASLGFQVGAEQSFFVILLMNTNATRCLTEPSFEAGGEARGTAGDASTGEEGKVATPAQAVLVYDDRKGLYGGAAIKGGAISPDDEANRVYYQESVTINDILFAKRVKPTDAATALASKLSEFAKEKRPRAPE